MQHLKAADWTAGSSQSRGDRAEQCCCSSASTLAVYPALPPGLPLPDWAASSRFTKYLAVCRHTLC